MGLVHLGVFDSMKINVIYILYGIYTRYIDSAHNTLFTFLFTNLVGFKVKGICTPLPSLAGLPMIEGFVFLTKFLSSRLSSFLSVLMPS